MSAEPAQTVTDAIDQAIREYYQAEGYDSLPTGWVLLVADMGMTDNTSGVVICYPNGAMPRAQALGIVEMGRVRMHAQFAAGED